MGTLPASPIISSATPERVSTEDIPSPFRLCSGQEIPDAPEFFHLGRGAERNTDMGVHGGKKASDLDVVLPEVGDDVESRAAGLQHREIRKRSDSLDFSEFGLVEELLTIGGVAFFAHLDVVEIVVGHESRVGADGVEPFLKPAGGKSFDFLGSANGIADANSCEAVNF
jgi:hypothetical protein